MKVFEVCLTNYCNFKCSYCISDKERGFDKFSEPLKIDENGDLIMHPKELSQEEIAKRENILKTQGKNALDEYVYNEELNWLNNRHLKHDFGDWLNFESLIKFVKTQLNDQWLIVLTGGEPLYYPKVEDLILELVKYNKVLITTNASMVRSKTKLLDIDRDRIFFRVGFHPEYRNWNTFQDCMAFIIENKFKYIINYVAHPSYYEDGSDLLEKHVNFLGSNGYLFEVTPFEGMYKNLEYPKGLMGMTDFEKELFNKNSKYNLKKSIMGTSFIMCEPNGEIFECQGKQKKLGNVYENTLTFEHVSHSPCFFFRGCNSSKSANTYLDVLLGEKFD